MRARHRSPGISAAAWFYGLPGFRAPLTPRERHEIETSMPPAGPHDPATCINGVLGCCLEPACQPCVIVFDFSRHIHHCETHNEDVEQDDPKEPRKCSKGAAA